MASGAGRWLRGWATRVRAARNARSWLYRTARGQTADAPIAWLFGERTHADGIGAAVAVAAAIAAATGSSAGTSNVTGAAIPPLTIGKAAVKQLSYRNAANPPTGTIVAGEADVTVTAVDASTDQITVPGHGYYDFSGDGPGVWDTASGGTVPGGVTNGASYWFGLVDSSTLKLATSDVNAATSSFVNITSTGSGTHRLLRAQNTQNRDSLIIAAAIRGDWDNTPGAPYDNKGNAYTSIDAGPYSYSAWPTAKMGVFATPSVGTVGGSDHRVSLDYGLYTPAGAEADEVTVAWLEINGPAQIEASSYQEVTVPAASMTSLSVTISKAATLICIVGGSAGLGQQHVFTFGSGFTKLPQCSAEAEISANGYCQISIGYKSVDPGGTPTAYTCTVNGTSNEVGKIWLIAVTSPNVGASQGTSTVTATGAATSDGTGTSAGTSDATGAGASIAAATGASAGAGDAAGVGGTGGSIGAAEGTSDATATGTAILEATGAADGTSGATAVGGAVAAAAGTGAGTSGATAVGAATSAGAGSAAGTATDTAGGAAAAASGGASSGTGDATAPGLAVVSGAGSASGTGDATAVGGTVTIVDLPAGFAVSIVDDVPTLSVVGRPVGVRVVSSLLTCRVIQE